MVKENIMGKDGKPINIGPREKGYFYFINGNGDVMRAKQESNQKLSEAELKRRTAEKEKKKKLREAKIAESKKKRAEKAALSAKRHAELAAKAEAKAKELKE